MYLKKYPTTMSIAAKVVQVFGNEPYTAMSQQCTAWELELAYTWKCFV